MPRVFLITGCSSGFGKSLVQEILDRGDCCVATARKPETMSFRNTTDRNYLATKLDVLNTKDIDETFKAATEKFGRVDVVVNNAGHGLVGTFESLDDHEIRRQMDVNFFGLLNVTRRAMETMREQKPCGGRIQQVTSIGGQVSVPICSMYIASKWAAEGFTESISKEVKPEWNIQFTLVEPGQFRTEWVNRSVVYASKRHPAYDHFDFKETVANLNGTQRGDPDKGAKAMYELAIMESPPLRVVIGSDAYRAVMDKIKTYEENYKKYEELANSTDFDDYQQPAEIKV